MKNKENFDWKTYINSYEDLSNITNKKDAVNHWNLYGIKEHRKLYNYNSFPWIIYINNYKDLENLKSRKDAWNHWINTGRFQSRKLYQLDTSILDIKLYKLFNKDLSKYSDNKLMKHYLKYGINENRLYSLNHFYNQYPTFDLQFYKLNRIIL